MKLIIVCILVLTQCRDIWVCSQGLIEFFSLGREIYEDFEQEGLSDRLFNQLNQLELSVAPMLEGCEISSRKWTNIFPDECISAINTAVQYVWRSKHDYADDEQLVDDIMIVLQQLGIMKQECEFMNQE